MGWELLLAQLLSVLIPMLVAWIQKWIEGRLKKASERLPAVHTYASEADAAVAVFDAAIEDLPRWAFLKRALLRRAKAACVKNGKVMTEASAEDAVELRDLANALDNE